VELPEAPDGATLPARSVLRHSLRDRQVERIVALGPLTNVAALLREEPELFEGVEVIWMGGGLGRGNATPLAEFNAWADPRAAAELIGSEVPLAIVGLDVTDEVAVRPEDVAGATLGSSPPGRFLERVLRALMEVERPTRGERAAVLHDPCAVLACASEGLFRWEQKHLEVRVEEGRERGRLREVTGCTRRPVRYAVEAHGPEIVRLFMARLARWA
jgi:inosine-uridine nucleoside N-ribohydrolase